MINFDTLLKFLQLHPELTEQERNELTKYVMDTMFKDTGRVPIESELTKKFTETKF